MTVCIAVKLCLDSLYCCQIYLENNFKACSDLDLDQKPSGLEKLINIETGCISLADQTMPYIFVEDKEKWFLVFAQEIFYLIAKLIHRT